MRKILFLVVVAALVGVVFWQWPNLQGFYNDFTKTDSSKDVAKKDSKVEKSAQPTNTEVGTFSTNTQESVAAPQLPATAPAQVQTYENVKNEANSAANQAATSLPQQNSAFYPPQLGLGSSSNSPFSDITPDPVRIKNCIISPIDEALVAAQEQGVIDELTIKEGDMVKAKQVVGRLEDSVPQLQKKAAEAEAKAAKHKAESMETINFMIKAAAFSRAAYDKAVESNRIAAKAVSEIEVKEKYLAYEKDLAQIARERETQTQDKLVAEAKAVEVDNAQKAIERRQITSPYDGYVEEIKPHLGEWVKAGDVIFKVKKIDTLRIDGLFNVKRNTVVNLYQLPNREVEVEFEDVKNGQLRRVPGRVVNVNLSSDGGEEYRMRVEVTNIKDPETNQWVVRPGMLANIVLTPGAK